MAEEIKHLANLILLKSDCPQLWQTTRESDEYISQLFQMPCLVVIHTLRYLPAHIVVALWKTNREKLHELCWKEIFAGIQIETAWISSGDDVDDLRPVLESVQSLSFSRRSLNDRNCCCHDQRRRLAEQTASYCIENFSFPNVKRVHLNGFGQVTLCCCKREMKGVRKVKIESITKWLLECPNINSLYGVSRTLLSNSWALPQSPRVFPGIVSVGFNAMPHEDLNVCFPNLTHLHLNLVNNAVPFSFRPSSLPILFPIKLQSVCISLNENQLNYFIHRWNRDCSELPTPGFHLDINIRLIWRKDQLYQGESFSYPVRHLRIDGIDPGKLSSDVTNSCDNFMMFNSEFINGLRKLFKPAVCTIDYYTSRHSTAGWESAFVRGLSSVEGRCTLHISRENKHFPLEEYFKPLKGRFKLLLLSSK